MLWVQFIGRATYPKIVPTIIIKRDLASGLLRALRSKDASWFPKPLLKAGSH